MDFGSNWTYQVDNMSEEKIPKSRRKSQIKAVTKYRKKNFDRVVLDLHKGIKDAWQSEAESRGFDSLSAFIRYCVEKEIGIDDSE